MAKADDLKRFFVKLPPELHRELKVLAIREGTNVELLGGKIIADAMRKLADAARKQRKP